MSRQAARSEATRAKLIAAGRDLFAKKGYADVGTEELVGEADVTRGALYHHFGDKRDLFRAVHEEIEAGLVAEIGSVLARAEGVDPVEALELAAGAVLDFAIGRDMARITLIDAPSVLGWEEWREIDARYGLGLAEAALAAAMEEGRMPEQPVRPLAHLLLAALGEAAIMVAVAPDPAAARKQVEAAIRSLIRGMASGDAG